MSEKNIAVEVKTQEEWDEVIKSIRTVYYNAFGTKGPSSICISLDDGCHCSEQYYQTHGYNVISFKAWKKMKETPSEKSLIGLYLKYTSSVTEEVFKSLVAKLRTLGCSVETGYRNDYDGFKYYGYLKITKEGWRTSTDHEPTKLVPLNTILGFRGTLTLPGSHVKFISVPKL